MKNTYLLLIIIILSCAYNPLFAQPTLFTYNFGWTPNAPTDPNNPSTSIDNIVVVQGFPTISAGTILEVNNITVTNDFAGFISLGEIHVYGGIQNEGVFQSSGKIKLLGNSDQEFSGSNTMRINNLELGNAGDPSMPFGLTINSTTLNPNGNLSNDRLVRLRGLLTPNSRTINFNDQFVFGSRESANGIVTGIIGNCTNAQLNGNVVIERYIPAKRAYRLLTAPFSSGTLKDNWMEGVNNPTTQNNLNPSPGFGTHMSGNAGSFNDWDETQTNNPSVFTLNANAMPAAYEPIINSSESFSQGGGFLVFIRGSRSTNLNSNTAAPTPTVLRSKGNLLTDSFMFDGLSLNTGDFNVGGNGSSLIGNPYQSPVDMQAVLSTAQEINPNFYHIYDPTIGDFGAYVTVAFGNPDVNSFTYVQNGVLISESSANRYLQPGQAAFVNTINNMGADGTANPQLTFTENSKYSQSTNSGVFRSSSQIPADLDKNLSVKLYQEPEYITDKKPRDAVLLRFHDEFSSEINLNDAPKSFNQEENLATELDGNLLSIDSRNLPSEEDEIQLNLQNLHASQYLFKLNLNGLQNVEAYLVDNFLGTSTLIENNGETIISFSTDSNEELSVSKTRFKVVFAENSLNTRKIISDNFTIYPNPTNGEFFIETSEAMQGEANLSIFNMLGAEVYKSTHNIESNTKIRIAKDFPTGVYLVQINNETKSQTKKLVVK